jgi:hypothetical protein
MSQDYLDRVKSEPSATLVLLKKRLEERGVVNFGKGSLRNGMRPIYAALEEMDAAGVKVRLRPQAKYDMAFNAGEMDQGKPLDLWLWDLVADHQKAIRLREDEMHEGEYIGISAKLTQAGPIWWPHTEEEVLDHVHFQNAADAIEWLVDEVAPCVVTAPGLDLAVNDPGRMGV